jgi:hypothetical protein
MAHIHSAVATTTGPVVVPLNPYEGGCSEVSRALALDIVLHPSSYYVDVHNMEFRRERCEDSSPQIRVGYERGN